MSEPEKRAMCPECDGEEFAIWVDEGEIVVECLGCHMRGVITASHKIWFCDCHPSE